LSSVRGNVEDEAVTSKTLLPRASPATLASSVLSVPPEKATTAERYLLMILSKRRNFLSMLLSPSACPFIIKVYHASAFRGELDLGRAVDIYSRKNDVLEAPALHGNFSGKETDASVN
jgi:hypothetical protein